jgi:hypothetical protein
VNPGAALVLDDSIGAATASRAGGRAITFAGGALDYIGNSAANSTETLGGLTFARGTTVITVVADANRQANLVFGAPNTTLAGAQNGVSVGATVLFRGSNLGNAAANGVATIRSGTTGFVFNGSSTTTAGSTAHGILAWALIDASVNGIGTSFATFDSATGNLRALAANEFLNDTLVPATAAGQNIRFTNGTVISTGHTAVNLSVNSLTFAGNNSGVLINNGTFTGIPTLSIASGGILVLDGVSATISGGILQQLPNLSPLIIHTLGTGNLTINSTLFGGNSQSNTNI